MQKKNSFSTKRDMKRTMKNDPPIIKITEPAILFRICQKSREGLSQNELYGLTDEEIRIVEGEKT